MGGLALAILGAWFITQVVAGQFIERLKIDQMIKGVFS